MAVWFCVLPFTERSIGVMGSQPDRYSATRISAVSMMSEWRFEAWFTRSTSSDRMSHRRVIIEYRVP